MLLRHRHERGIEIGEWDKGKGRVLVDIETLCKRNVYFRRAERVFSAAKGPRVLLTGKEAGVP